MTNLICDVENCLHNSGHCCELGEVAVKGRNANESETTCCSTFCDTCGCLHNENVDNAEKETCVRCSATNCTHNDHCECKADKVDINGLGANHAINTECSSFKCK